MNEEKAKQLLESFKSGTLKLKDAPIAGSATMIASIMALSRGEERDVLLKNQLAITKVLLEKIGAYSGHSLDKDFENLVTAAKMNGLWDE